MKIRETWLLLPPLIIFALGVRVTKRGENEIEAGLNRAQKMWRSEDYQGAIEQYKQVYLEHPKSQYAPAALWEAASIYYGHYYDLARTARYLEELVTKYPGSPEAKKALLRLAQMHETEVRDLGLAVEYWTRALESDLSPEERRQVQFKLGDTHLKQGQLEKAKQQLAQVVATKGEDHLGQQAYIRLGTIAQIEGDHQAAIESFEAALAHEECRECCTQARLGLVESYEFMGNLPRAIAIAAEIPPDQRPEAAVLLDRLGLERP